MVIWVSRMGSNLFDTGGSIPSYSPLWSESQNLYFTRFCPLLIGRILPSDWSRVVSIVSIVSIVPLVSLIPNSARAICFHFTQLHLLFSFCFLLSRTAAVGILLLHVVFLLKKTDGFEQASCMVHKILSSHPDI